MGNLTSNMGSGAEQDRFESHFGGQNHKANLSHLKQAASHMGSGAEQDRYGSHFGLEDETVKNATKHLLAKKGLGAEQDRYGAYFGLGNDGWERAKKIAGTFGSGAEQVGFLSVTGNQ